VSELADLLERFRRGAELIAVAVTGAAGAELDYQSAPGRWSVRQIVCHVADSELVGSDRIRRTLAEDNPTLLAFDQDAWALNLGYSKRRLSTALEFFRTLRAENYEILKDFPESAFARTATHSERGVMTLLDLLRVYAEHAEGHARQLREVRQKYKESRAGAR
jgi:hypothetical protein